VTPLKKGIKFLGFHIKQRWAVGGEAELVYEIRPELKKIQKHVEKVKAILRGKPTARKALQLKEQILGFKNYFGLDQGVQVVAELGK
jgi:hypothetical protein